MGQLALRPAIAGMLPESVRAHLRPVAFRLLGLATSGKLARAIRKCEEKGQPLKIVVGAGVAAYEGWISTDVYVLDIRSPEDWSRYFKRDSIDAILSEHVLEHLSLQENRVALSCALHFLKPGGHIRIAVPDGNRSDAVYRTDVSPPRDGHQMLFDVASLSALLREIGFKVTPLEYFDEHDRFHAVDWKSEDGHVARSVRFDRQMPFRRGDFFFTSLIVDGTKPR